MVYIDRIAIIEPSQKKTTTPTWLYCWIKCNWNHASILINLEMYIYSHEWEWSTVSWFFVFCLLNLDLKLADFIKWISGLSIFLLIAWNSSNHIEILSSLKTR